MTSETYSNTYRNPPWQVFDTPSGVVLFCPDGLVGLYDVPQGWRVCSATFSTHTHDQSIEFSLDSLGFLRTVDATPQRARLLPLRTARALRAWMAAHGANTIHISFDIERSSP